MADVVTITDVRRAQEALERALQVGAPPERLAVLEQAVAGLIARLPQPVEAAAALQAGGRGGAGAAVLVSFVVVGGRYLSGSRRALYKAADEGLAHCPLGVAPGVAITRTTDRGAKGALVFDAGMAARFAHEARRLGYTVNCESLPHGAAAGDEIFVSHYSRSADSAPPCTAPPTSAGARSAAPVVTQPTPEHTAETCHIVPKRVVEFRDAVLIGSCVFNKITDGMTASRIPGVDIQCDIDGVITLVFWRPETMAVLRPFADGALERVEGDVASVVLPGKVEHSRIDLYQRACAARSARVRYWWAEARRRAGLIINGRGAWYLESCDVLPAGSPPLGEGDLFEVTWSPAEFPSDVYLWRGEVSEVVAQTGNAYVVRYTEDKTSTMPPSSITIEPLCRYTLPNPGVIVHRVDLVSRGGGDVDVDGAGGDGMGSGDDAVGTP